MAFNDNVKFYLKIFKKIKVLKIVFEFAEKLAQFELKIKANVGKITLINICNFIKKLNVF